jgi:hypothetical protein
MPAGRQAPTGTLLSRSRVTPFPRRPHRTFNGKKLAFFAVVKRRRLGKSDLIITPLGLGTWAIGGVDWILGWGPQDDADGCNDDAPSNQGSTGSTQPQSTDSGASGTAEPPASRPIAMTSRL